MKTEFFLLLTVFFLPLDAHIPRFLNGRPRGGFLGNPATVDDSRRLRAPEPQWFIQPLNHFAASDTRTWKQKYFVNDFFYKSGGPLFVQIGGEGKANPIWLTHGAWMEYAESYNAYCIMVEHRYYGDSHPTPDMSSSNLKYLSSEQALADLAEIITYFQEKISPRPKTIVFGGSYSGALAAWFRMKYPHLAFGAVASSAPVLATVDFQGYLEVVDSSLKTFDNGAGRCNMNIQLATNAIAENLKTKDGRNHLKKIFHLCSDIDTTNQNDVDNLYSTLANNFLGVVQYNKDNRAFEGAMDSNITIDTVCSMMTSDDPQTPLDRYAAVNSLMMKVHGQKCVEFEYQPMIKDMQATAWNTSAAEGGRQWVYQTCVEFAFYQSTDSPHQPFGQNFPLKFFLQQCTDIYGAGYTEAVVRAGVKETNIGYGALALKVTRVIFPNGSIDPWSALGIKYDLNPQAKAIFIKGTAHCANMYPPSPNDLPALRAARHQIQQTIGDWLKQ